MPEHFYKKNMIEYPFYEFVPTENPIAGNTFQVREKDEKYVFGSKHIRMPGHPSGNPGVDIKSKEEFLKMKYQGNSNIIGRKKNQIATTLDFWRNTANKSVSKKDPLFE